MLKNKVKVLLDAVLEEDKTLFLIEFLVTVDNKIRVVVDGDNGVTVQDCMKISRAIEHNLDREELDFSLEVASAGAASPMILPRQYKKNIGRKIAVNAFGESFEGNLTSATDKSIILEWKAREPKPIGKGKVTVQKEKELDFADIKEAKVILKY